MISAGLVLQAGMQIALKNKDRKKKCQPKNIVLRGFTKRVVGVANKDYTRSRCFVVTAWAISAIGQTMWFA